MCCCVLERIQMVIIDLASLYLNLLETAGKECFLIVIQILLGHAC